MSAKFHIDVELKTVREKAIKIAAEGVDSFYSLVGLQSGRALFFTCMRTSGSGPAMICGRLNSNIRPQIINGWHWSEPLLAFCLKTRSGFHSFVLTNGQACRPADKRRRPLDRFSRSSKGAFFMTDQQV